MASKLALSSVDNNMQLDPDSVTAYDWLYLQGGNFLNDRPLEDIIRFSHLVKSKSILPSITDKMQEAKDKLGEDPYNLELIKKFGIMLTDKFEWQQAANVMMRGWKRVSEFTERRDRFEFLMKLTEASYRNFQFKQAVAVLMDIDVPEEQHEKIAYLLLACHVYSQGGDAPKALSMFSKAIESEELEVSIKYWAATAIGLKKVGAFEAAKNAVVNKKRNSGAQHQTDESQIQTVESWANMSLAVDDPAPLIDRIMDSKAYFKEGKPTKELIYFTLSFLAIFFFVLFYWLEQRSLKRHKLIQP